MSVFFTGEKGNPDNTADPGILTEVACESIRTCEADQYFYKGLTAQWMGETMQVAPFTRDKIASYLQSSAEGAAKQCSGGRNGTACGNRWTDSKYDGRPGLGQEMSALNVFLANLAVNASAPINANTTVATTHASGPNPSATTTNSSTPGPSTASTSSKPSSGSQRMWAASWTLPWAISAALLSVSFF